MRLFTCALALLFLCAWAGFASTKAGAPDATNSAVDGGRLLGESSEQSHEQLGPAIFNSAWSKSPAPAGEPVEVLFTVKDPLGNKTATVRIYEWNSDGRRFQVDELQCILEDGIAHYRLPWLHPVNRVQTEDENATL